MRKFIAAVFILFSTPVLAAEPEIGPVMMVCDPAAGLHVMKVTPGQRHNTEIMINGTLETPTPGYSYSLDHQNDGQGKEIAVLRLRPPAGVAPAVISKLNISQSFGADPQTSSVEITLEKSFNWGPDRIACEVLP